jgi:hypothetical protein
VLGVLSNFSVRCVLQHFEEGVVLLDVRKHESSHVLHVDLEVVVLQDSFLTAVEKVNENLAMVLDSGVCVQLQVMVEAER